MIDIKEKIEEIVKKISGDKNLAGKFLKNPVKTIEDLVGVDLPDEAIGKIIEGVKSKISLEKVVSLFDSDGDGKPDLGVVTKFFGGK